MTTQTSTVPIEQDLVVTIASFFQDGGVFMYVILVVLAIGLAITLDRMYRLSKTRRQNQALWKNVLPYLEKGELEKAMDVCEKSNTEIGVILAQGLSRATTGASHDETELALEEGLMESIPQLETRTPYIATLANVATLLGLLGTIMGLIKAFTAVASADPAQKADLLSASISVAMNTTAFGLMAAIPLLLSYTYIQSTTDKAISSLESVSVKFLNLVRHIANSKKDSDSTPRDQQ